MSGDDVGGSGGKGCDGWTKREGVRSRSGEPCNPSGVRGREGLKQTAAERHPATHETLATHRWNQKAVYGSANRFH